MCGISGVLAYGEAAPPVALEELRRMCDAMIHRGPDDCGEWLSDDARIGLGHRRLSIIDLSSAAAQPMANASGHLLITFNGEIYNYKDLRQDLEARGHVFRTRSDTEVLLHLYADKGAAMVHDLRGMFAFGIWDVEARTLFLARDPYGIKPLYYSDVDGSFRFASQVKALLAGGCVSPAPDAAGWVGFHLFGSVPEPFTIHKDIRALPVGATLLVTPDGAHEPKVYASIATIYHNAENVGQREVDGSCDQLTIEALLDSVRHHLVADVPVGAFLSAGVDSGALVGLMRDAGQSDIQTVTIAFDEFRGTENDESPLAEQVASTYGTNHVTRRVTEAEFKYDLPHILAAMDQPSIDGINTWFASKAAVEAGLKVAVSGLGGDELFGGYPSFANVPRTAKILKYPSRIPHFGSTFQGLLTWLAARSASIHPKLAGLVKYGGTIPGAYFLQRGLFMPWELPKIMPADFAREGLDRLMPQDWLSAHLRPMPKSDFSKVACLEASVYMRNQLLRDTDWASMAHSLEVRVPLVDIRLLEQLSARPRSSNRTSAKEALAMSPCQPLPDIVTQRRKTGFQTPIASWLPTESAPHFKGHWSRRWALELAARAGVFHRHEIRQNRNQPDEHPRAA